LAHFDETAENKVTKTGKIQLMEKIFDRLKKLSPKLSLAPLQRSL